MKLFHRIYIKFCSQLAKLIIASLVVIIGTSCDKADIIDISQERPTEIPPDAPEETDTIRLLLIGNSFAILVTDTYLPDMLRAEGKPFVVGRVHLGSCSLLMHLNNAIGDKHVYNYREFRPDSPAVEVIDMSLSEALSRQKWNIVSFQQVSGSSGIYESYGKVLSRLMKYVDLHISPYAKRVFYQTWAYSPSCQYDAFAHYNNNQEQMYSMIVDTSRKLMDEFQFDMMVPAGTAIQNARATELGNDLTYDGFHLDNKAGQFTACAVWCEMLTGNDARNNTFNCTTMTEREQQLSRAAAHAAVLHPYQVTYTDM